jgi:hypothetical protein
MQRQDFGQANLCGTEEGFFVLTATYAGQDRSVALGHWPLTCNLLFSISHHQRGIPPPGEQFPDVGEGDLPGGLRLLF